MSFLSRFTRAVVLSAALATAPAAFAAGVSSHDPARLPAGEYVLDKSHASLVARVSHMGFSSYTLRFDRIDASFTYDPAAPAASKIAVTVDPASIDTGTDSFSHELAGASWMNAAAFPKITFTSTSVDPGTDGKGTVTGDLTFLGVTRPVTLNVTWNGVGSGMIPGGTRTGFSATAHIKRTDFGNKTYIPIVGDDVDLVIEAEFFRR